jgi:fatty-acyl-CoA synthase
VPELPRVTPLTSARWPASAAGGIRETTIGSVLRAAAGRAPGQTALIYGDPDHAGRRQWTYAELLADAERAARALLTRFSPGERVAVWAPNSPQWIILEFGAALAGLTLVTVNPAYRGAELAHLLGDSKADSLFRADTFQQQDTRAVLAEVRGRLPRLREVLSFGDWDAFTAAGGTTAERPLPEIDPAPAPRRCSTPRGPRTGPRGRYSPTAG